LHIQTERLERVLFALKERIPVKLTKDAEVAKKRSGAKEKANVDVYRGGEVLDELHMSLT
jgi:hypothetical protein